MSTRKPQIKSKNGCAQCRKRRIKCDESRPGCQNCAKRRLECSLRIFDPLPRSFVRGPGSAEHNGPIASIQPPSFLDYLSQDELIVHFPQVLRPRCRHLLQHFAEETSYSITHNDASRAAWCAAVPQLTARHVFVLQGTISISALHASRHVHTESEKNHLRNIAAYQMNTGLIKYRETIANVTEENAESLLAFSVTVTAWGFSTTADEFQRLLHPHRSSGKAPDRDRTVEGLVVTMSNLHRTVRGVLVILVPCWNLLVSGILREVTKRDHWPYPIPSTPDAIEMDKRLRALENMWMRPGRPYEHCFDTLRQALSLLREEFARIAQMTVTDTASQNRYGNLTDWTAVISWLIQVPLAFVELVEKRQPEAWVILAHYAMLPVKVESVFWIKEFGPNLVSAAALVLGEHKRELIEWPAGVVGVDLDRLYFEHRHEE